MRILVIILFFICVINVSATEKDGYSLSINYTYNKDKDSILGKTVIIVDKDYKTWGALAGSGSDKKIGAILLYRIVKANQDALDMEFILVDINKLPSGVISIPSLPVNFQHPQNISINGDKKFHLEVIAKSIKYTPGTQ